MNKVDVPFEVVGGSPTRLRATVRGKTMEIRLVVSVGRVLDNGTDNADGSPSLDVQANWQVSITPVEKEVAS